MFRKNRLGLEKMKAVILSRGRGVHLLQGQGLTSKVLIPINGMPLLYYILKHFYFYGISEIIICVDSACEEEVRKLVTEYDDPDFRSLLAKINPYVANSGENNKTGSMLFGVRNLLEDGEFIITYNDIITDVNFSQLIQYHKTRGRILTVIGVHPTVRQGIIQHEDGIITKYSFEEPVGTIIKGGYFLVKPRVFEYLTEDCILENEPFQRLISEGQAVVFDHKGFWKQVDSWRDLEELEKLFEKDSNVSWMIK